MFRAFSDRQRCSCLLQVPKRISNVPSEILQPSEQWKDRGEFDKSLRHLASLYSANFKKWVAFVYEAASVKARCAAELPAPDAAPVGLNCWPAFLRALTGQQMVNRLQ